MLFVQYSERIFVMDNTYKYIKPACYTCSMSMSVVSTLSPILFLTFHNLYGISFSLLGLLVLINFVTQLGVDLLFSFFSHRFNIQKTVKIMPFFTLVGLLIYGLYPFFFPNSVYVGLCIGTIVFSAAAGLSEVLISPIIAAIPHPDPDREMSKLHSVFAWGVVGCSLICTLFIYFFSSANWQYLSLFFIFLPILSSVFFSLSPLPPMSTPEKASGALKLLKSRGIWLCVFAIFLGGSTECTMGQWASSYLENALGLPKLWGDILGVALFSAMLGLGRTLYAKFGKNIETVLFACAIGSSVCYAVAALSPIPFIALAACAIAGMTASMLWPGTLVVATERFPAGGVFMYALMAAGGDLGASVGPQLLGLVTDIFSNNSYVAAIATDMGVTPDAVAMKGAMLVVMLFPLIAVPVYGVIKKGANKKSV